MRFICGATPQSVATKLAPIFNSEISWGLLSWFAVCNLDVEEQKKWRIGVMAMRSHTSVAICTFWSTWDNVSSLVSTLYYPHLLRNQLVCWKFVWPSCVRLLKITHNIT